MTTQLAEPRPASTRPPEPRRGVWRTAGRDLAYTVPAFLLGVLGFVALLPLVVLGVSTLVIVVGAFVLGFALLLATGLARENRALARFVGADLPEPRYRSTREDGSRRLLTVAADPQAWKEAVHALVVAFPLRLTIFVLGVTWVATGLGGVTYLFWGVFLPDRDGGPLVWLRDRGVDLDLAGSPHLTESALHFVTGVVLLLLAPLVLRLCVLVDTFVARVFLTDRAGSDTRWSR